MALRPALALSLALFTPASAHSEERPEDATLAAEAAWTPRWGFTGTVGFNAQTNAALGFGARAGVRRWWALRLGWAVELGYDLEASRSAALHQLSLAGHLDVLWPREGSAWPNASVSLFAAPVLALGPAGAAGGWRVGVRASALAGDTWGTWPLSVAVSFEQTFATGAAASRAVRFSLGLGI